MSKHPLIYSHRAGAGLYPENTLPAVKHSLSLNVDFIDIDIVLSQDKILVANHDPFLQKDLTRNETGSYITEEPLIKNLSVKEIKRFDVGRIKDGSSRNEEFPDQTPVDSTYIPTLIEVIDLIRSSKKPVKLQLEIKINALRPELTFPIEDYVNSLRSLLENTKISHLVEIQCFDWAFLIALQKALPGIKTAYLYECPEEINPLCPTLDPRWTAGHKIEDFGGCVATMVKSLGGSIIGPKYPMVSKKLVEKAHKLDLKVVPWTIDTPSEMRSLIEIGVDGIITNHPNILNNILNK